MSKTLWANAHWQAALDCFQLRAGADTPTEAKEGANQIPDMAGAPHGITKPPTHPQKPNE